ncbi:MAG: aldehyde dehydrogenase family protein, partial [Anaerovoracaceae bacterium]
SSKAVDLMNKELAKIKMPKNLIQIVSEQSRDNTADLIAAADTVIATGGDSMVKAAYSSGTPAYGVGAGNVQCIFDTGIDFNDAAKKVVASRSFDYGIICSGEQSIICNENDYEQVLNAFKDVGAYIVGVNSDNTELKMNAGALSSNIDKVRSVLFDDGKISRHSVGQSADRILLDSGIITEAKLNSIEVDNADVLGSISEEKIQELIEGGISPERIKTLDIFKLILLPAEDNKFKDSNLGCDILGKEKMGPVITVYKYKNIDEAIEIARRNLELQGKGHSVVVHSNSVDNIEKVGLALSFSRLIVNQPSTSTAGGSFFAGFAPTTTLGCGSWGGNSISENLDYIHLMNVSRIGHPKMDNPVPTDEELWNE